jgi:hypothetical protein
MAIHIKITMKSGDVFHFDDCTNDYNETLYTVIKNVDGKTKTINRFPIRHIFHIKEEY